MSASPAVAADAAYKRAEKTLKSKFKRLDDHMKQARYGKVRWMGELKSRVNNTAMAIKDFEKKWPKVNSKPMWASFNQRVSKIKKNIKTVADKNKAKNNQKLAAREKADANRKEAKRLAAAKKAERQKKSSVQRSISKRSIVGKVKKEQTAFVKNGRIEVWDRSGNDLKKVNGGAAYLSFSSDYTKANENKQVFNGKEYIYAHLNLPKKLTEMLPSSSSKYLQYYKVILKATVNGRSQENANKIQRGEDFDLAYNTKYIPLAVIPEKGFFENFLDKYRSDGKYKDSKTEEKALRDLIRRNFSRQMAYLFKDLSLGEHQVEMEFQVTAKLRQSKYVALKNIKGTFVLQVDQEAKDRYNNTFNMLTKLYREYEGKHSIAQQRIDMAKEEKMLANMSPRDRERYTIAKRSPTGYMAAYGGERAKITFTTGKLRTKNSYIDINWPDGSCKKCEGGNSSIMVSKRKSRSFEIPKGASVTINGRSLISKVSTNKSVILYWYY